MITRIHLASIALSAALLLAEGATAQRDEFDFHTPSPAPGDGRAPNTSTPSWAPPPPDGPVLDASKSRSVRVFALDAPELRSGGPRCGSARMATSPARVGHGLLLPDGRTIAISPELVGDAVMFAVRRDGITTRTARLRSAGQRGRLAYLTLDQADETTAEPPQAPEPTTTISVSVVRRTAELGADVVPGTLRIAPDALEIVASGLTGGEAVYANGALVGLVVPGSGPMRVVVLPDLTGVADAPPVDLRLAPSLVAARQALARVSLATTDLERCAPFPSEQDVPEVPDDAPIRSEEHWLLGALAWNRATLAADPAGEPADLSSIERHLTAAARTGGRTTPNTFLATVVTIRTSREAAASRAEQDRAQREAAAEAAARERIRRRDLPVTYTAALVGAGARDGSTGYGTTGLSLGVFATVPKLSSSGAFGISGAVGGSLVLSVGGSIERLFTLDLGATLRLGGRTGTFLLATWSPALVGNQLSSGELLALRSYRIGAGVALHRTVIFGAFRGVSAEGDYPLYLGELGVALRFGPHRDDEASDDEAAEAAASPERAPLW